jgi:chromosome segregation ATPase
LIDQVRRIVEERDRLQTQLRDAQQEHNRTRQQLRDAQQERNQAQTQLRDAQQELGQAQTQFRNAQQERDQAQRERTSAQEQLSQMRNQEEQRRQTDELYETMMNAPGQLGRQYERGQSSRANDALPTTVEGMQEQLEGEQGRQQESRARVRQLRDHIQRIIWEQGNQPPNERLNQLLKYPMEGILQDQRLVEEIYPPYDQPAQDQLALRQSLNKALRHRLLSLYLTLGAEYTPSGLRADEIAGEFVDQLQEQMDAHERPSQEYLDTIEDVQEELTGRRPNRTQRR